MRITQLLLPLPKKKPEYTQMIFKFKEDNMKINAVKFFRANKPNPVPEPKPSIRKRFEAVRQGKKFDRMA